MPNNARSGSDARLANLPRLQARNIVKRKIYAQNERAARVYRTLKYLSYGIASALFATLFFVAESKEIQYMSVSMLVIFALHIVFARPIFDRGVRNEFYKISNISRLPRRICHHMKYVIMAYIVTYLIMVLVTGLLMLQMPSNVFILGAFFMPYYFFAMTQMYIFSHLPRLISNRVQKKCSLSNSSQEISEESEQNLDEDTCDQYYIYWLYYIKTVFFERPIIVPLGYIIILIILAISTLASINTHTLGALMVDISYWSFLTSSIVLLITPMAYVYMRLGPAMHEYSKHIVDNDILPLLDKHIIIVGLNNLGRLMLKGIFFNIHSEKYENDSGNNKDSIESNIAGEVTDYDIIITEELRIGIVSRRLVLVDENAENLRIIYGASPEHAYGCYSIWRDKLTRATSNSSSIDGQQINVGDRTSNPGAHVLDGICVLLVCGSPLNQHTYDKIRARSAKLIIQALEDHSVSYYLARMPLPKNKVLVVSDKSSYDPITSRVKDRPIFLVNPKQLEGRSIGQRVFLWISKTYPEFISSRNIEALNCKIAIFGHSKVVYFVVKNLVIMFHYLGFDYTEIQEVFSRRFVIVYNDIDIEDEILLSYGSRMTEQTSKDPEISERSRGRGENYLNLWEFYPIRIPQGDLSEFTLKIPVRRARIENFEAYMKLLSMHGSFGLLVLISHHPYRAIRMTNRAIVSCLQHNYIAGNNKRYNPSIIVSAASSDSVYVEEQLDHYAQNDRDNCYPHGYPSDLSTDSKLVHHYVAANQFTSVARLANADSTRLVEVTVCMPIDRYSIVRFMMDMANLEVSHMHMPRRQDIKLLNVYSFRHRIVENTFVASATASISPMSAQEWPDNSILAYLLHGDENVVERHILNRFKKLTGLSGQSKDRAAHREYCKSHISDCPISLMTRKSDKLIPTYLCFGLGQLPEPDQEQAVGFAHIKIWAEGDSGVGSLAESVAAVNYIKVQEKSRSCGGFNIAYMSTEICPHGTCQYARMYAKLDNPADNKSETRLDNILAIKVKCDRGLQKEVLSSTKDSENPWLRYAEDLYDHLTEISVQKYEMLFNSGSSPTFSVNSICSL